MSHLASNLCIITPCCTCMHVHEHTQRYTHIHTYGVVLPTEFYSGIRLVFGKSREVKQEARAIYTGSSSEGAERWKQTSASGGRAAACSTVELQ